MDTKIRSAWLHALESGKYMRAEGKFCNPNGHDAYGNHRARHCCLGVLWEVLEQQFPDVFQIVRRNEYALRGLGSECLHRYKDWEDFGTFHEQSANLLGITEHQSRLVQLNDSSVEDDYKVIVAYINLNIPAD